MQNIIQKNQIHGIVLKIRQVIHLPVDEGNIMQIPGLELPGNFLLADRVSVYPEDIAAGIRIGQSKKMLPETIAEIQDPRRLLFFQRHFQE